MQLPSSLERWCLVSGLLLLATACSVGNAGDAEEGFRKFENIYEPSGVQQLPDGRFVVVEDESSQPISLFTLGPDGNAEEQALWRKSLTGWLSSNRALGSLEDLEDVSIDAEGRIYAITSHSRKSGGKRDDQREHIVRFGLHGADVVDMRIKRGLRKAINHAHDFLREASKIRDVKGDDGFNIEGLSFDRDKRHLLIGLRAPLMDERAVIVTLLNPQAMFDDDAEPLVDPQLQLLDLDRGGIRAMAWDEHLGGYLIVSRRPDKNFKLWLWDGHAANAPTRLRAPELGKLRQAEGVTPVVRDGQPLGVLIVSDEGNGLSGKPGRFVLIPYAELTAE